MLTRFLRLYSTIVVRPIEAFQSLKTGPPSALALIIYLVMVALAAIQLDPEALKDYGNLPTLPIMKDVRFRAALTMTVSIVYLAAMAGITYGTARMFHGKGTLRSLWTAILLTGAIGAVVKMIPFQPLVWLVLAWSFAIEAVAIKILFELGWGKAVTVLLLSWVGVVIAVMVGTIALASAAAAIGV